MRTVKAVAACALGASISFFCDKLVAAAKKYDLDLQIETFGVDKVRLMSLDPYDLVIIAPHVKFHAESIRKRAGTKPVVVIDGLAYATLDADKMLKELILPNLKSQMGG
ncbi:MAG TPA: hypothetical protein GX510_10580 [Firmicutes bacterium]|nr:hypothetical protein [Candidatus Fermentithermobacillaceae bacterium]